MKAQLRQGNLFSDGPVVVGGPAVKLMPDYLSGVSGVIVDTGDMDGVLQIANPQATRTTIGCPNRCAFCAVPRIEGAFRELDDWPDRPVICDNNILAASAAHVDRVFDRLEKWHWADFNQGLDARLLTRYHAGRLARIGKAMCRLALDHASVKPQWERAFGLLRDAGIPKSRIRSYVLVGFGSGPDDAWGRCEWVEKHGVCALPQWFHALDQLEKNIVTETQAKMGWSDYERRRLMQWYYQHKKAVA